MSLISVVIPVHNTAKYLRKCIDSVLSQTLHDMEVILVENCSTDGSYQLCDELAATDSRIRVLHIEIADLATARNRGVAAATSEYVGFIDSDDYIAPGMYEALYENARKYDADLCFCNFSYDREGQIIPYSEETGEVHVMAPKDVVAAILSEYLGMDHDFICRIKVAGLFHDIGKIGIPDRILRKPDRVTREEYEEIRNHPVIGSKILSGLADFRNLVPIVRGHHERIDGTGYPDGLRGEEIPEGARILSIVDAFDALVSNRVYRSGRSWEEALDEIRRNRGSQFDAEYADGFFRMMTEDPQPILKLYSTEGES